MGKKKKVEFLTKFQGDPKELWAASVLYGRKCAGCPSPAQVRFQTYAKLADYLVNMKTPNHPLLRTFDPTKLPATVQLKHEGACVKVGEMVCCQGCRATLERICARQLPSWVLLLIDDGPPDIVPVIQAGDVRGGEASN